MSITLEREQYCKDVRTRPAGLFVDYSSVADTVELIDLHLGE